MQNIHVSTHTCSAASMAFSCGGGMMMMMMMVVVVEECVRTSKRTPSRRVKCVNFSIHFCTHCIDTKHIYTYMVSFMHTYQYTPWCFLFSFGHHHHLHTTQTSSRHRTHTHTHTYPLLSFIQTFPPECFYTCSETLFHHKVHGLHAHIRLHLVDRLHQLDAILLW